MAFPRSVLSKAALGLGVALLTLGTLEAVLALTAAFWMPEVDRSEELRNENDPFARVVDLGTNADEALGEMVLYNIRSNELTHPDSQLLFRVRPNPTGALVHGYSGINAEGFRGRLPNPEEARASRSVVILGDSCGFGWGIRDYPLTFSAILEEKLARADPDFRVYNLSQPGYSSAQARDLYESWGPDLDPEIVVVYLGWNDLWPAGRLDDAAAMALTRKLDTPLVRGARQTHLYRFLDALLSPSHRDLAHANDSTGSESFSRPRVASVDSIANFRAIIDDAQDRGARVLVILAPSVKEWIRLPGIDRIFELNDGLREAFGGEVEFVELPEMQEGRPGLRRLFLPDGYHPNPLGAQAIARGLVEQIQREPVAQ